MGYAPTGLLDCMVLMSLGKLAPHLRRLQLKAPPLLGSSPLSALLLILAGYHREAFLMQLQRLHPAPSTSARQDFQAALTLPPSAFASFAQYVNKASTLELEVDQLCSCMWSPLSNLSSAASKQTVLVTVECTYVVDNQPVCKCKKLTNC